MKTRMIIVSALLLFPTCLRAQHLNSTAGTHLALSSGSALVVSGNLHHNGTSTVASDASLVLSATGDASIENLKAAGHLLLSGGGTYTLLGGLEVLGNLHLVSGRLLLGDHDLTAYGAISGSFSASNMVVTDGIGKLFRAWNDTGTVLYPVGELTGTAEYTPASLQFTSGTFSGGMAGVRVVDAVHASNSSTTHYLSRYWTVTSSGITSFTANAVFDYVTADVSGSESSIYTGQWDGSAWTLHNAANTTAHSLSATVSSFSDFTGGELGVVPVELVAFSAHLKETTVHLRWETATELNNYGFEIERRAGSSWETVGFVPGHGTSSVPRQYAFPDPLPARLLHETHLQYRLRQIDRDGSWTYSPIVEVHLALTPESFALHAPYPNPFRDALNVAFDLQEAQQVLLTLHDAMGREVLRLADEVLPAGGHVRRTTETLSAGLYLLRLVTPTGTSVRRIMRIR